AAWCWCWMTITACEKGRSTPRSPICSAISPRTCNWRSRPGGDPPLPLGRLRAAGEVLEIRAVQLRFSDAGARALLNDSLALGRERGEVALLRERTEGWPAGLLAGQGHFTLNGENMWPERARPSSCRPASRTPWETPDQPRSTPSSSTARHCGPRSSTKP